MGVEQGRVTASASTPGDEQAAAIAWVSGEAARKLRGSQAGVEAAGGRQVDGAPMASSRCSTITAVTSARSST